MMVVAAACVLWTRRIGHGGTEAEQSIRSLSGQDSMDESA